MVAKRRTIVTFGLVSSLRVSKLSTVTVIGGVVVAKRRTIVTFGLGRETRKRGEWRGEERREKGEERGERRGERGESREEKRGRERRGERSEDRRGKRREYDPGPEYPDWFRAWGVLILAVYVSVSALGFVDPVRFPDVRV